ncbi:glycoside hydrolase family 2 protein [Chitinophaga sp.]|uniref:glycoside hydrolase family 2 protein n=1 Tax=Chitinophaga sp. TaxID=1869181 RepID=UPI002C603B91|nr:glycoside hydrolase family 2 TIM barrel-domain containing protein [Chitinophaga sp.]HWV67218.1 glycoside hydrolase family 2 TIM barrel-domain containing protein [Chitinophaga sp.]
MINSARILAVLLLTAGSAFCQQRITFSKKVTLETIGKGSVIQQDGILQTQNAYATFGDSSLKNYRFSFRASMPGTASEVQIWAGFRAYNRNDRYILALRGGRQNNLYLSRLGYMGTDQFLALRTLDFHPVPGKWYALRVEVCGARIRVFLNDESLPRIDVTDSNSDLAPSGKVTLGGGWISTRYDDLSITPLPDDALEGLPSKEYAASATVKEKETLRKQQRDAWHPIAVTDISRPRTEVSLNGNWLFMPVYQLADESKAISPQESDEQWHTMNVPDFWNPIRIWLHGETFGRHPKGASDAYFQRETARCEGYTFDYKKTNAAWYRQWINLPAGIEQKETLLRFDAVSKVSEVYINGKPAGKHTGMFGQFVINGKGLFKAGKNLVTVKVIRDYVTGIKDAGKVVDVAVSVEVTNKMLKDLAHGFYNDDPAGIWQPVSLLITEPLAITDVFIQPGLTGAGFDVTVKNNTDKEQPLAINMDIPGLYNGKRLAGAVMKAGEEKTLHYEIDHLQPLLWSPQTPNLYNFTFSLESNGRITDSTTITSGFRTFASKDGFLYLNGRRYWLRGGNQTPFALAPNDTQLAERFYDLMKAGNMEVTRTHTSPYNENWLAAADRKGVGISFEGTWPWLMINSSMPDEQLISKWADEFISLLKKYRNHPSILFWTVNNEMKFYDNDPDPVRARLKMKIISEVVKRMRKTDGTRPICFDSNYKRNEKKFGKDFFRDIDDGDIDDIHAYINWYDYTIFKQFNGEFQQRNHNEGRPLISQEMSSGYSNNETGHPVRFYTQVHQTPQELVGDLAYEFSDPAWFMESQAFITGEQAEAYRRTNDKAAGILHFALISWFRNVYDAKAIEPYPTYYALQRALQPVLVSAELWGRHFYAGTQLPARICIVNDRHEGTPLSATELTWQLQTNEGAVIATGKQSIPEVPYYGRQWVTPNILIPKALPAAEVNGKLVLTLKEHHRLLSSNEYKIILADQRFFSPALTAPVVLIDGAGQMKPVFDALKIKCTTAQTVSEALAKKAAVYVFAGLEPGKNISAAEQQQLQSVVQAGGKILLLDAAKSAAQLLPQYVSGVLNFPEGDIVNMDIPEAPVFNGIGLLDLRYFNNNKRELPAVCNGALTVKRQRGLDILAKHINVHGYIKGEMAERAAYMSTIQGATLVKAGNSYLCTMSLEKAATDPVAGKLLYNIIAELGR